MSEKETVKFWLNKINELKLQNNPAYSQRIERCERRLHNLIHGIVENKETKKEIRMKYNYSRKI